MKEPNEQTPDITIIVAPHAKTDRWSFSMDSKTGHFRRYGCGYLNSATSHSLCVFGAVSALKIVTPVLEQRYLMFNKEPERRLVIEVGSMYNELAFAFNGRTTRNARHKAAEHLVAELAKESERFDVTWRKATERETSDPFHWMNRQLREHRRDGWPQPEALSGPHNAF